jgi:hypothetical protein
MTKPLLLSERFGPDVWPGMIETARAMMSDVPQHLRAAVLEKAERRSIPQQLYDGGLDLTLVSEAGPPSFNGVTLHTQVNRFNSFIAEVSGDVYFWGWWIHRGWFDAYRDKFLAEFTFRDIEGEKNRQYERDIKSSFSIGVHIRRGTFVREGQSVSVELLVSTIQTLHSKHPNAVFFIFSDEADWCKANAASLGLTGKEAVFVEGNFDYKNNYVDIQLMAMCNVLVVGSSSFSYLASILNATPGFYAELTRSHPLEDIRLALI